MVVVELRLVLGGGSMVISKTMFSDMSQVGAKGAHLFFLLSLTMLVTLMLAGSMPRRAAMLPGHKILVLMMYPR